MRTPPCRRDARPFHRQEAEREEDRDPAEEVVGALGEPVGGDCEREPAHQCRHEAEIEGAEPGVRQDAPGDHRGQEQQVPREHGPEEGLERPEGEAEGPASQRDLRLHQRLKAVWIPPAGRPRLRAGGRGARSGRRPGRDLPARSPRILPPRRRGRRTRTRRGQARRRPAPPPYRGALRGRAGRSQELVEIGELADLVSPCSDDHAVSVEEEGGSLGYALEAAVVEGVVECVDSVAIPVGEQGDVDIERLAPGAVRPGAVPRDPEDRGARRFEFGPPVTQEDELVSSGTRPVEQIEEEQDVALPRPEARGAEHARS